MRRITLTAVSTLAILVLLFSYRTSLGDGGSSNAAQALSGARVVASSPPAAATSTSAAGPDPVTTTVTVTAPGTQAKSTAAGSRSTSPPTPSSATSITTPSPTKTVAGSQTVQGASEMTRYGPVQVQVVISDGKITDVQALTYPTRDRRDQEINSVAIPMLRNQVLSAQNTHVQGVSGATYTTDGYLSSLQSALDLVGFTS